MGRQEAMEWLRTHPRVLFIGPEDIGIGRDRKVEFPGCVMSWAFSSGSTQAYLMDGVLDFPYIFLPGDLLVDMGGGQIKNAALETARKITLMGRKPRLVIIYNGGTLIASYLVAYLSLAGIRAAYVPLGEKKPRKRDRGLEAELFSI